MRTESDSVAPATRAVSRARTASRLHRWRWLIVRRGWIMLLTLGIGAGLGWALCRFRTAEFVSVGRMIVNVKLALPEGAVFSEEMSSFLGTQSALMQSGLVLNRAHTRVLAENPDLAARLAGTEEPAVALRVSVVPKTTIFVLQAIGTHPEFVQPFLQATMEEYTQLKREMRSQTSDSTLAGLTGEILRLEQDLRRADSEIAAFQSTNGVVLLPEQANSAASYTAELEQRLALLRSERNLLQSTNLDEQAYTASALRDAISSGTGQPVDAQAEFHKASQQLLLLRADQAELGRFMRPKHPRMVALGEEIARRQRLIDIFRQQTSEHLDGRRAALALQIANLEKDVADWNARALEGARKAAELSRLRANATRTQSLYDRLLATMQTLDVTKEISPESVTIMEKASPAIPGQPPLGRQVITGAILGFALGVALLFMIDRMDDRILSFTELRESFDEEVLGQIPLQPGNEADLLLRPEDDRHGFHEAYRNLRSSLLYMFKSGAPRVVLVTSSVPGEGKSLTAANLAISMAHAGARVLLVDADLRKGGLHRQFNTVARPGLAETLAEQVSWIEAVHATGIPNLWFLPRGETSGKAVELLVSRRPDDFLRDAAARYDHVILDTAPVMAADDVTSLAPHAEGVLFVLRSERTSARVGLAALDMLRQRKARVLGLVLNGVRPNSADYHCYKYQDYYRVYPQTAGS